MTQKQIALSSTEEGKALLNQWHHNTWQQAIISRGTLFYHWADWHNTHFEFDDRINPDHLKGWWIRLSELKQVVRHFDYWQIRHKPDWLFSLSDLTADTLIEQDQIEQQVISHFQQGRKALMLSACQPQSELTYQEHSRVIVVSDSWPEN